MSCVLLAPRISLFFHLLGLWMRISPVGVIDDCAHCCCCRKKLDNTKRVVDEEYFKILIISSYYSVTLSKEKEHHDYLRVIVLVFPTR